MNDSAIARRIGLALLVVAPALVLIGGLAAVSGFQMGGPLGGFLALIVNYVPQMMMFAGLGVVILLLIRIESHLSHRNGAA